MTTHIRPSDRLRYIQRMGIVRPRPTHWRAATCEEVGCKHYREGWISVVPSDSMQAEYIRRQSGRRFQEDNAGDGLMRFTFEAGQKCFQQHEAPIEREPLFVRKTPQGGSERWEWERWRDHFNEIAHAANEARKRG